MNATTVEQCNCYEWYSFNDNESFYSRNAFCIRAAHQTRQAAVIMRNKLNFPKRRTVLHQHTALRVGQCLIEVFVFGRNDRAFLCQQLLQGDNSAAPFFS